MYGYFFLCIIAYLPLFLNDKQRHNMHMEENLVLVIHVLLKPQVI